MKHTTSGDWRPAATLEVLKRRAWMLERIRAFFSKRGVLEVETPVLSTAATPDPHLQSFATRYGGPLYPHGQTFYLQTSPEFPMKRLLAAGSGSIYQICKVFRDGESGRLHNPEFTMLEWYRVGFGIQALMEELTELVHELLQDRVVLDPAEVLTYQEAFERHAGLNPHTATTAEFAETARRHGLHPPAGLSESAEAAEWRDLLLTHVIEPRLGLGRLTYLQDFPASQASLARIRPGTPPLAERFELYLSGIELANGFHELADANEQRLRFERQHHLRTTLGLPTVPVDDALLKALAAGLPDCSGVAVGLDRVLLLSTGSDRLEDVLSFPFDRA